MRRKSDRVLADVRLGFLLKEKTALRRPEKIEIK
jgi:hypothetical protein